MIRSRLWLAGFRVGITSLLTHTWTEERHTLKLRNTNLLIQILLEGYSSFSERGAESVMVTWPSRHVITHCLKHSSYRL